jgi:hypothetical protein
VTEASHGLTTNDTVTFRATTGTGTAGVYTITVVDTDTFTFTDPNTGSTTVTVTGGSTWGPADTLTVTASAGIYAFPATTDVGDEIVVTDTDGQKYRLKILTVTSTTVATARVDRTLPVALRGVEETI